MCTICSKDVCTTVHLFEASKVSPQQGRYMFRLNTVLHKALKTLILTIKEEAPISITLQSSQTVSEMLFSLN